MFLKAIGIKALVLSISISSLILAGEKFEVCDMGKIKDQCMFSSSENHTIFVFLKKQPNKIISWIEAPDTVKSSHADKINPNILHLEFGNGEKCSVDLTESLQKFYSQSR